MICWAITDWKWNLIRVAWLYKVLINQLCESLLNPSGSYVMNNVENTGHDRTIGGIIWMSSRYLVRGWWMVRQQIHAPCVCERNIWCTNYTGFLLKILITGRRRVQRQYMFSMINDPVSGKKRTRFKRFWMSATRKEFDHVVWRWAAIIVWNYWPVVVGFNRWWVNTCN